MHCCKGIVFAFCLLYYRPVFNRPFIKTNKLKAIRDGVIDATIDHEGGFIQSKETVDVYSTSEPAAAFHKRITFCLNIHNDAIKALSFPDTQKESEEEEKERLKRQQEEKELASIIDQDDDDSY